MHMPSHTDSPILCTVDVVLLTLRNERLHVLLLPRDKAPHQGLPALPGGFVHAQDDATAWHAARRVLNEKAGIDSPYLEQLATYSGAERDPRGWSVSIVYYALVPEALLDAAASGAAARIVPAHRLPALPFDHRDIIQLAVARVRTKSAYSSLPVYFCGDTFTMPQLQAVYESVLGEPINKVSFRRKIDELDMLEPVEGEMEVGKAHRPAQFYRLKRAYSRRLSTSGKGLGG